MKDQMAHYKTLDRIDNLLIGIQLFKKSEPMVVVEELEAKWQEVISEYHKLTRHAPLYKSKKSKKTNSESVRIMYTITDQGIDGLASEFERKLNVNKMMLQRDVVKPEPFFGDEYFSPLDTSQVGIPPNNRDRWDHNMTQNVYSVMKFVAKNPKSDPGNPSDVKNTETLLTIQYFGNGNFSVQPDFTKPNEKHELIFSDETYLYTIENRSEQLSEKLEMKEKLIFEEFFKRLHDTRKERLPHPIFESVPKDFQHKYCVFGEIMSGEDFEADRMYIEYLVHLQEEWKPDPRCLNQLLSCKSQTTICTPISNSHSTIGYFGIPFEYQLVTNENEPRSPVLYFKLKSVDLWNHEQVIGYGSCRLPVTTEHEEVEIRCWKPEVSDYHKLKSFFLGGSPELQDMKFNEVDVIVSK